jgi:hypothetical protein
MIENRYRDCIRPPRTLLENSSGVMRSDVPPPSRAMSFSDRSEAVVAGVRAFLPDASSDKATPRVRLYG